MRVAKVPSTADPLTGVMAGVAEAGIDLSKVALFSHGTTVATNALITRRLPTAAMVTTRGFRDVIEIRRGTKEDLWDTYKDVAPPYVRRLNRLEVTERVDYAGDVLAPLEAIPLLPLTYCSRRSAWCTVILSATAAMFSRLICGSSKSLKSSRIATL